MVILVHSSQMIPGIYGPVRKFTNIGQLGCQLFFILSAYGLCYSIQKSNIITFYKKRIYAIVPGYYLTILLYLLVDIFCVLLKLGFKTNASHTIPGTIINLLLLQGIIPLKDVNNVVPGGWYIGTSAVFYLIFPLLFQLYKHVSKRSILAYAATVFSILINICIALFSKLTINNNTFLYFSFITQLPCFLVGIQLYFDYCKGERRHIKTDILGLFIWGVTAIVTLVIGKYLILLAPLCAGKSFYHLYFLVDHIKNRLHFSLISNIINRFGKYSYSIYLLHILVMRIVSYAIHVYIEFLPTSTILMVYVTFLVVCSFTVLFVAHVYQKIITRVTNLLRRWDKTAIETIK